jgi:heterodisulfide reductase subunit A/quinone-modifying oxidoreductase subunit QmoB
VLSKDSPRIGVYLRDAGGALSRSFDLQALERKFAKAKGVARWEARPGWLDTEGLSSVRDDISAGRINRLLWVGAFTPHETRIIAGEAARAGLNPYLIDYCAPEEHAIRGDGARDLNTRRAIALLSMALARARLLEPLAPLELPAVDAALVVGGGIAGLNAAASLVSLGKRAYLIEKEAALGGRVAQLSRYYPLLCDPRCGLEILAVRLRESELAEIHTLATVEELSGSPGSYRAVIQKRPRYVSEPLCTACGECLAVCPEKAIHPAGSSSLSKAFVVERDRCPQGCRLCEAACPFKAINLDETPSRLSLSVGAVIVATGWDPYPVESVREYGYGRLDNVVTSLEMEQLLGTGELRRRAGDRALSVGFIQCVGSRDVRHVPYCSDVCCSVTLKQIWALKEQAPDARCIVFYIDIRATGYEEILYQRVQRLPHVLFVKGRPAALQPSDAPGRLRARAEDVLSGRVLAFDFDLVVLAGGLVPSAGTAEMGGRLDLPRNEHGFFETHLPCVPWESQRTGIYTCGASRGPMDAAQSIESATGAVVQSLKLLESEVRVSPTFPVLDKTKCDKCKRCVEECPFAAFAFDEEGFPRPDLARCRQCGICQGACPVVAISLGNATVRQLSAQVEALSEHPPVPGEPLLVAILCESDAYHAALGAVRLGLDVPPNVFFLRVPCAGAVNNAVIADALACGIDGVLIGGCQDGQCHNVRGSQLVRKRSGDLGQKLRKMRMDEQRVRFEAIEVNDSRRYAELVQEYAEQLRLMGPNPFKA